MSTKHAFLIGAFKNPDYLLELIDSLDSPRSTFYIHVNLYNESEFGTFKERVRNRSNIHYYSKLKVKWGGSDFFMSQMLLCNEALKDKDNEYFHFVTGQDILCRPLTDFMKYIEESESNFINYASMLPEEYDYRYSYYSLYELINLRSANYLKKINSLFIKIQNLFHLKRKDLGFSKLYWGSGWWSIRRDACQYVLSKWNEDKTLHRRLKFTFGPDEMFFQSVLLNSGEKFPIVNDNLRYIKWEGNASPKTLTLEDLDDIKKSGKFIARKVDPKESANLISAIRTLVRE